MLITWRPSTAHSDDAWPVIGARPTPMPRSNPPSKLAWMPTGSYTILSDLISQPDRFLPSHLVFSDNPFLGSNSSAFSISNVMAPNLLHPILWTQCPNPQITMSCSVINSRYAIAVLGRMARRLGRAAQTSCTGSPIICRTHITMM